jgi:predicted Zn-dependent protease
MLEKRIRDLLFDARANARKQGLEAEFNFHRERSSLIRLGNSSVALSTFEELSRLDVTVQQGRKSGSYSLTSDITSPDQLAETLRTLSSAWSKKRWTTRPGSTRRSKRSPR